MKKEWKIQNIAENSHLDLKAFKHFKASVWILKGSRAESCMGNRHNRTDCIPVQYPLIQTLYLIWLFFQHLIISPVWCYTYNEHLCRKLVLKKADIWRKLPSVLKTNIPWQRNLCWRKEKVQKSFRDLFYPKQAKSLHQCIWMESKVGGKWTTTVQASFVLPTCGKETKILILFCLTSSLNPPFVLWFFFSKFLSREFLVNDTLISRRVIWL